MALTAARVAVWWSVSLSGFLSSVFELQRGGALSGSAQLVPVLAADLVQRLGRQLDNVVVVDHDRGLRRVLAHGSGVPAGHVHRDRSEHRCAREQRGFELKVGGQPSGDHAVAGRDTRAGTERDHDPGRWQRRSRLGVGRRGRGVEFGEEPVGGGLAFALGAPDHGAAAVIGDQRQVPVALAPRDLIDRDLVEIIEPVAIEVLGTDALDDPTDRLPIDPRQPARRGLIHARRQPRDEIVEVAGEPGAVAGERDPLHVHAVLGALQAPQSRADFQPPDPEIQVPPPRLVRLEVVAMPRAIRALRAMQTATTQRDPDDHTVGLKRDVRDPYPGQLQQARECSSDAHSKDLHFGPSTSPKLRP